MEWKSLKLLFASAISLVLVTHVVKKIYTRTRRQKKAEEETNCKSERNSDKLNDVLIFSSKGITTAADGRLAVLESREKLIRYLSSARQTLDVCMYLITSKQIADAIVYLGRRHVMVRIIVDGDMAYSGGSQVKRFKKYSFIEVRSSDSSRMMHHKFCVVDGPEAIRRKQQIIEQAEKLQEMRSGNKRTRGRRGAGEVLAFVMSGSLNWSTQALHGACDSVIVTSHPDVVHKFEMEFANLWQPLDCSSTEKSIE